MSDKIFVKDVQLGELVSFFMLTRCEQAQTKAGKPYWIVDLADKTGQLGARIWNQLPDLDMTTLVPGVVVKVQGEATEYRDDIQLKIFRLRVVTDLAADGVDFDDFIERSERDPEEMYVELLDLVDSNVTDVGTKDLVLRVLGENAEKFKTAPAAKRLHHGYVGGLLEHTLSLVKTSLCLADLYRLDKNIVVAGAVFHDIGKIFEMRQTLALIEYTVEGTLLGHISLGMQLVADAGRRTETLDNRRLTEILHVIASHHGLLEYGSPKVPLMREAIAFHLADMLDSRMAICDRIIKGMSSTEETTSWIKELDGPLYRPLAKEQEK